MVYTEKELMRIAERENNVKRNYLVVNPFQGKHVPVMPSSAFMMFKELALQLKKAYANERMLLIGFAETATAIGAAVAVELDCKYIQTTREIIADVEYLYFLEAHSHATEQKIVKNDIDDVIDKIDRIVFIEDEVTTGNTIKNIINILNKEYSETKKYAVASLLNGMNKETLERYNDENIELYYLVKTNHDKYSDIANSYVCNGDYVSPLKNNNGLEGVNFYEVHSYINARRLANAREYLDRNHDLWNAISKEIDFKQSESVLIIGTEEFMFPALFVANRVEELGKNVKCHSTTRSPIAVSKDKEYPLHVRYELRSLYDDERVTYIYDLDKYDCVVIITDSYNKSTVGVELLVNALKMNNNNYVNVVRWCE